MLAELWSAVGATVAILLAECQWGLFFKFDLW